jgi:hypothetical protein
MDGTNPSKTIQGNNGISNITAILSGTGTATFETLMANGNWATISNSSGADLTVTVTASEGTVPIHNFLPVAKSVRASSASAGLVVELQAYAF